MKIFAINPGATSTKIGLYEDDKKIFTHSVEHYMDQLEKFSRTIDQLDMRVELIEKYLEEQNIDVDEIDVFVARGGPFKPMKSGTYKISGKMIEDVLEDNVLTDHISNIACLIADKLSSGKPAYIVDPVSVDEFDDISRISGLKLIERRSLSHALNMKMVAKKWAAASQRIYDECNLIVAHLGSGISVSAHRKGRMVDVNNANEEGPFSPQRAADLPTGQLTKLCFSGKYSPDEMKTLLLKKGGMYSYLGTDSVPEAFERMKNGDKEAELILSAMMYQVSKYIGSMAAVLKGIVDRIIITGGIAYNPELTDIIEEHTRFIAPITVYPGEDEIEALVMGVLRVINNPEEVKEY
ncbi:MAG: butyrate kinase, partial [candidate division WOR-3 bacterium]|nr:butyrate kinase [candidate division WOR-3 bacterium]